MATVWRGRISLPPIEALAEPGWFVTGNRALLTEKMTERAVQRGRADRSAGDCRNWLWQSVSTGGLNCLLPLAHLIGQTAQDAAASLGRARARATRGLDDACRPRRGRWLRRRFHRLGPEDHICMVRRLHRRPPQGRTVRHRRAASVAKVKRGRPLAIAGKRQQARGSSGERIRVRAQHGLSEIISEVEQSQAPFMPTRQAS